MSALSQISQVVLMLVIVLCGSVNAYGHRRKNVYCKTRYYTQTLDHFSFSTNATFQQRYVICKESWTKGGPILFYTGNEGDIMMFVNNTGFMFELAPQLESMVIFAEHRYYGKSLPFDGTLNGTTLAYLTSMQALADYNDLIDHLKHKIPGAARSPVIAFGGSYGGMLAAWFRMKYPATVIGALASSAPILQFDDMVPCNTFAQIATRDYKLAAPSCPDLIRKSWSIIQNFWRSKDNRDWLRDTFNLCGVLDEKNSTLADFRAWLFAGWTYMAMTDYPYPTNFLKPMPGWPVKAACQFLSDPQQLRTDKAVMQAVFKAVSVYYNYSGQATGCFNISDSSSGTALGDIQWDYQACSEMVIPDCSDGKKDMFYYRPWNLTEYSDSCQKTFNVRPDTRLAIREYGGDNLQAYSNIIFSNGNLDPWSGGGVLKSSNPALTVIVIQDAAHHLDLRASHPDDPDSVIKAREKEIEVMKGWIAEYRARWKSRRRGMHGALEAPDGSL
ncbi:lysosomal Pro-X carboxypeptidase-like [Paramacrobiotus metropolitanus]|uniref:lysosomal Pro-X carboxypeptidase-like n=1 Tax=Paramacrobiotus metropolitanus TaxID=2943436 RepID=UPI0024465935|nr:lysosomal Pro-X carboxypeptidase-like [Paramacrobiotus metropolitanus]